MAIASPVGVSTMSSALACRRPWRPSARSPRYFRCATVASASRQDDLCRSSPAVSSRRHALTAGMAAISTILSLRANPAAARYGNWDNESAAVGSCAIGDDGDECRAQLLSKDRAKTLGSDVYGSSTAKRSGQLGEAVTTGVPVSVLDDEYGRATLDLMQKVENFAILDLYDPERVKAINAIKKDGFTWVSKYARGGSARKQAARKMYIVVDALQGHFASNGFSPLPPSKLKKVLDNVAEAKQLLTAGK